MSGILDRILARKREEVAALKRSTTLAALRTRAAAQTAPRGFAAALARVADRGRPAVIAEIKRASPSKGLIREDFDPAQLAAGYAAGGAACLSVLTDRDFFQGADDDLVAARAACALPVIRKDFLIDEWQIAEARALAADCVLLIAAALDRQALAGLHALALDLGLDVLVEVHDAAELDQVLSAGLGERLLLGINNRNLHSFETQLDTTLELLPRIPAGIPVVTESGIGEPADVQRMMAAGVRRFLVGESLMRRSRPGEALAALIA